MSDQFLDVDEPLPSEEIGIESILHQLLDVMAAAKSMPLSSSVMVSRDEVISLVQAALDAAPEELRQARWLLREREEFMAERTREAEALMDEVRARRPSTWCSAPRSCGRPTRWRSASSTTPTRRRATLRHQAEDFVDQKLAGMEIVLDRLTRTVQAGRARLAAPLVEAKTEDEGAGSEEDGFFDQDQT